MHQDALDLEIVKARAAIAEAEKNLLATKARLDALELAATLRPHQGESVPVRAEKREKPSSGSVRRGGRQLGSITKPWQHILGQILRTAPQGASPELVAEIGQRFIGKLRSRDVIRRFEHFEQLHYVKLETLGWVVQKTAIDKFNLMQPDSVYQMPPSNKQTGLESVNSPDPPKFEYAS